MKADLEGRVAVVTGAVRGIERAVALALAQAGAKVAALARTHSEIEDTAAQIKKSGCAQAFAVDVTDTSGVRRAIEKIEAALGPIDVLVNNAGQLGRIGPFVDSELGEWWRVLEVNLRGPMLCTRAVLPGMMARRRGRIVNIASGVLPYPYLSAYVTSKTALVRFSETLAGGNAGTGGACLRHRPRHNPHGDVGALAHLGRGPAVDPVVRAHLHREAGRSDGAAGATRRRPRVRACRRPVRTLCDGFR